MSRSNRLPRLVCWLHKPHCQAKPSRNKTCHKQERRSRTIVHDAAPQGSTAIFTHLAATEQAAEGFTLLRAGLNELCVLCCASENKWDASDNCPRVPLTRRWPKTFFNECCLGSPKWQLPQLPFLGLASVFVSCCGLKNVCCFQTSPLQTRTFVTAWHGFFCTAPLFAISRGNSLYFLEAC